MLKRIMVVGGNIAGLKATETLRQQGFDGEVFLVSAEAHTPYDRPPLSKQILTRELEPASLHYRDMCWFADNRIELLLGKRANHLDLNAKTLTVDGEQRTFDGLVIATGARAREFPTALAGIHTLRTLDDALRLRDELVSGARVVVIGAGFIGAEVASSALANGAKVTIIEAASAPLARALGVRLGRLFGEIHAQNGVELTCSVQVSGLRGVDKVKSVLLSNGSEIAADVVVIGIGVVPNTEWLADSGLELSNGLACDATLNAGHEFVYGAGDVALWPNAWTVTMMRGEQWTIAAEQGKHAALNLLAGRDNATPFSTMPYFWSDQYGARIQSMGRTDSEVIMLRGSPESRPFIGVYRDGYRLVGVVAINAPKAFTILRNKLNGKASFEDAARSVEKFMGAV
ncbi:NAD(P)/FAD-dependent oxidoreductase [Paraburkholderia rhynchosiae]|uniref:FAD-dependent oxidoreductase n=1 Tax=Paraburkholderia rhynchosiae TaxID=487049 RepID=A0A2N7WBY0_9BURK|nr:FAD-dependent oxidoreductase [Paraburkholderia rhynchosiae]PMS26922.1 FAD-dependent oxidoreductase [Paraburkholderia rhynchosiae]CAB3727008.1 Rhodocoxin reductase [Paraburkholderia rhynchosiae]